MNRRIERIYAGYACRSNREYFDRMPLGTLSALTEDEGGNRISIGTLSKIENGQNLVRDEIRQRLERAFERVDKLRSAVSPLRIDMRDATALLEALRSFEAGNLGELTARIKARQNPPLINF